MDDSDPLSPHRLLPAEPMSAANSCRIRSNLSLSPGVTSVKSGSILTAHAAIINPLLPKAE